MNGSTVTPQKVFLWLAAFAGGVLLVGLPVHKVLSDRPGIATEQLDKLTVPVQIENLAVRIEANGTVEPVESVNISPKNPGIVARLLVEQGDMVKAGQEVAIMDNEELFTQGIQAESLTKQRIAEFYAAQNRIQADIQRSQAVLRQAQARLTEAKERIPKEIDQARSQVAAATATLDRAKQKAARFEALFQSGAIDQDSRDATVTEVQTATAQLQQAKQRFEQLKNTANPELEGLTAAAVEAKVNFDQQQRNAQPELTQINALIDQADAQKKIVSVQYQDTIIRAPFDGVVTQKFASAGAFVTPTTSASSTASATSSSILAIAKGLEVIARVPEVDIDKIKPGQDVEIVADSYPDQIFRGKVLLVAPEAIVENNVTSFEVRITLLSGREFLRSKMNTDVTFIGANLNNVMTVPTVAIATEDGKNGVLIPDQEGKPQFKPVTLGATVGDRTQIIQGVKPGDKVFIDVPEDQTKEKEKD